MSTHEPPGPGPGQEGGGPPSFEKPSPSAGGTPGGSPYGEPAPPPPGYGAGTPYAGAPQPGPPYGQAPEMPVGMPPLGGRGRRLVARIIDGVLVAAVCSLVVGWFVNWDTRSGEATMSLVIGIVYWVYESLMLSHDGQTVGKKAVRVRVARLADGAVPTPGEAWGRAAVYTLPSVLCCGLWVVIDGGWCLFDSPYRQCVHDKTVRSVVVSTRT
ncbi:RDD family protein [Peterkaempfera griseoplana]|uniref:RDD family protein n=1 Tax=Peterkaempfera griseoplana TaxID=66896 RepID=UPI0006E270F9|nr:RDD family protein [Peterkaempfera griseoplana]